MPPDASATKARLLQAATEEFTAYGVAGARVDRIAAQARANKRLIYVHFGTKEELFDIVVERQLGVLADAVPFTPDDLPAYAGALFDWVAAHPGALRLNAWKQLERPEPPAAEMEIYRPKLAALAARPGRARPGGARPGGARPGKALSGEAPSGEAPSGEAPSGEAPSGEAPSGEALAGAAPADILALVIGLATAWFTASPALRALAAEPPFAPARLAAHRAALVAAVAALATPAPAPAP